MAATTTPSRIGPAPIGWPSAASSEGTPARMHTAASANMIAVARGALWRTSMTAAGVPSTTASRSEAQFRDSFFQRYGPRRQISTRTRAGRHRGRTGRPAAAAAVLAADRPLRLRGLAVFVLVLIFLLGRYLKKKESVNWASLLLAVVL